MNVSAATEPTQRIDKWLWAARFFKTRSTAAEAISGGKVQVDGARVKPARHVRVGSRLLIRRDQVEWEVVVLGVSKNRLPARDAVGLYEELEASRERRAVEAARAREAAAQRERGLGRPTKRERREADRLRGR